MLSGLEAGDFGDADFGAGNGGLHILLVDRHAETGRDEAPPADARADILGDVEIGDAAELVHAGFLLRVLRREGRLGGDAVDIAEHGLGFVEREIAVAEGGDLAERLAEAVLGRRGLAHCHGVQAPGQGFFDQPERGLGAIGAAGEAVDEYGGQGSWGSSVAAGRGA